MDLGAYKNSKGQIWLNVASSTYVLPDFVNLDNHVFLKFRWALPFVKPALSRGHAAMATEYLNASAKATLLQHDCRARLRLPDGSVDHILCSHFLEHVHQDEMLRILADFRRVLRPGGTLHVIVPDLRRLIDEYLTSSASGNQHAADDFIIRSILSSKSRGSLRYRLMEMHGGFGLQHRWMYDKASMDAHVGNSGFEVNDALVTPSDEFRKGDYSVHVKATKA